MISKRCGSFWCMVQIPTYDQLSREARAPQSSCRLQARRQTPEGSGTDLVLMLLGKRSAFINPENSKKIQPDLVFLCMITKSCLAI